MHIVGSFDEQVQASLRMKLCRHVSEELAIWPCLALHHLSFEMDAKW